MAISRVVSSDSPARTSSNYSLTPEALKTIEELQERYRGLKAEDLDSMNPSYSCVLCGNRECPAHNEPQTSCPQKIAVTEAEWIAFYNFE